MTRATNQLSTRNGASARARIVAGARRHFFALGFRRVSMDELAQELGMSKKTLYSHFHDKLAIVKAAILQKLGELEEELEEIIADRAATFSEALRKLLACVQRHTEEIQPHFLRDIRRDAPELFKLVEGRRGLLIQRYFGAVFARGRRAGMIRKDIRTDFVVEMLLASVQAIINPHRLGELAAIPKDAFAAIISVILEGILTSPARNKR
ncbi:MAG TPA: TetR/AcrR family transcriptional regulator [Gemmata sp.]|nr:TetR/AcrR family transcriptional regulator [Gemmata sp.]